ncbi:MAG: UvrD-helicase domain-containing protein [Victivallaceae bacterium]|nr:UvrD-helicase domain-containing protein [Victivallaceae bacterium]
MQHIKSPDEININRHAVIEASAGTGKTYTITGLVMRLLLERKLPIEKILIVTFTEKATTELRERIYNEITERLEQSIPDAEDYLLLSIALNNFANAAIFTIHGFCQRILRTNAFENRTAFDLEVIDDNLIYREQLNRIRRHWPSVPHITEIFEHETLNSETWEQTIIRLARLSGNTNNLIYPTACENPADSFRISFDQLKHNFNSEQITAALQRVPKTVITPRTLSNRQNKFLVPLWEMASATVPTTTLLEQYKSYLGTLAKNFKDYRDKSVFKELYDQSSELAAADFALLDKFINQLNMIYYHYTLQEKQNPQQYPEYHFINEVILDLHRRVQKYKQEHNLISYDDMISLLYDSLKAEAAENNVQDKLLTKRLRQQYNVALVDEFQDTGSLQWYIFKRIFVDESEQSNSRIMLIGDPKQAIYGFRGADVHAYEQAKAELFKLPIPAKGYRLDTNYRSMPDLINGLNILFTTGNGWYPPEEAAVKSPDYSLRRANGGPLLLRDETKTEAINFIHCKLAKPTAYLLKRKLAEGISATIAQLYNKMEFVRKRDYKKLGYADICILVRGKSDVLFLEKALKERNIPHSFYKKPGIYKSDEAVNLQILLTALATKTRSDIKKAMLTIFFNLTPNDITEFEQNNFPELHQHWLRLLELAEERAWPQFFCYLLEDTGVIYRAAVETDQRQIANLQQISHELVNAALQKNMDEKSLCRHLDNLALNEHNDAEGDIHEQETEKPTVKIMTIHASKGLEFPVVFLFGGFTQSNQSKFSKHYDRTRGKIIYDISKTSKNLAAKDETEENKRLYYVAMTRAIFKLFLPIYSPNIKPSGAYTNLILPRLSQIDFSAIPGISNEIYLQPAETETTTTPSVTMPDIPPSHNCNPTRTRRIESFSSMLNSIKADAVNYLTEHLDADDELPEHDTNYSDGEMDKNPLQQLPKGRITGDIMHDIFEKLDYKLCQNAVDFKQFASNPRVKESIASQMRRHNMTNNDISNSEGIKVSDYNREFARLVWHTLRKPLADLDGVRLCDIATADRKHELEFNNQVAGYDHQHLINGLIDLLFRVRNRLGGFDYYLLDWKSTYSANGYTPETLRYVMQEHKYNVQLSIYVMAVKQWFESLELSSEHRLKGAIYIFSRGVNCETAEQNGIAFVPLQYDTLDTRQLSEQIFSGTGRDNYTHYE